MEEVNKYIEIGIEKTKTKLLKTLVLAILAGAFIAFAGAISTYVSYNTIKWLSGLFFPVGLILVVMLKTELFTGNSLLIIPLIKHKINWKDLIKNWVIVYIGNLIGSAVVALLIYKCANGNIDLSKSFIKIALNKVNYDYLSMFIFGVGCNVLVALSVFMGVTAKSFEEKILMIYLPIMIFVILGLEHCVANMFYLILGIMLSNTVKIIPSLINLSFVTLGNIVGGAVIALIILYIKSDSINNKKMPNVKIRQII